jgi:hypothetical protein
MSCRFFEGWEHNADGTFSMVFGYMNRNYEEELDVPVGADNHFEPLEPTRGNPPLLRSDGSSSCSRCGCRRSGDRRT